MLKAFSPPSGGARAWVRALPLSFLLFGAAAPLPAADSLLDLDVQPAALGQALRIGETVGKLRFLGMLSIPGVTVKGAKLSQLSDIAWDEDAGILYAISDKGTLFHLHPVIRGDVLIDLKLSRVVPLRELNTNAPLRDRRADAEGLDILRGNNGRANDAQLLISFERYPRILRYRPDGTAINEYALPKPLADRDAYAQPNRMLESVCHDSRFGTLTVPEKPMKGERSGFTRLYSLSGDSWRFPIASDDRVVSLYCLGNGEVLVLEGNFGSRFWRAHTTLKRVRLPKAHSPDTPLAPETLFRMESSKGFQIDNFEGIARQRGNRFFLVSDDNDFFLQRTLLLYFELLDD